MDANATLEVRRFNRTVAQRVGALGDHYLSRDRPLGAARVLWEIGAQGCEVRLLRTRLGLDSGYLSRLLRSLEGDDLVAVAPDPADHRVRRATLTASGLQEWALLDQRSDEQAHSMVQQLSAAQQQRLLSAMATVTTLLTAAAVQLEVADPRQPPAEHCLAEYFAELDRRFPTGFDPAAALAADRDWMRQPHGLFVIARLDGEPVGCGALRLHPGGLAEVKRVWVSPATRGLGLGRRLLADLEQRALEHGAQRVRLDSNASLTEAIALYRATGYREVAPFNEEPYADFWFEKRLDGAEDPAR